MRPVPQSPSSRSFVSGAAIPGRRRVISVPARYRPRRLVEYTELHQAGIRDASLVEVENAELARFFQVRQPGVGDLGPP